LGTPIESQWPRVKIGIPRNEVPRILAETLRDYAIEDVSVEDPPLEEVIADLFHQVS
jgi:ABC-2 type transport system ATP-binding protein